MPSAPRISGTCACCGGAPRPSAARSAICRAVDGEQVVAAQHVRHALRRVVDDHGQLVGHHPIGAAHHDVAARLAQALRQRAVHGVAPGDLARGHAEAQRGLLAGLEPRARRRGRQRGAGARVDGALRSVRRLRRRAHVGPRAEARVEQPGRLEPCERDVVERAALALPDGRAVPVQAEPLQIAQLARLDLVARAGAIEVLDAQQAAAARRARPQPGQERGAGVADVEIAAGGGRVASDVHRALRIGCRAWASSTRPTGAACAAAPTAASRCRTAAATAACARSRPTGDGILRVRRETGGRKGKTVTTISGAPGGEAGAKALAKELKRLCGSGGSVVDGTIEIQGDHRAKVISYLEAAGHTVKAAGG